MQLTPNVVDCSHYDNVTSWASVKSFGILGFINKVTEGPGMTDKTFAIRRAPCAAQDILYGAYHFLRPGSIPDQVDHFLNSTVPQDNLLLALDHEDPKVPLANARAFMELVYKELNRYPILYSGFLIKQQLGQTVDPFWQKIKLWLSHYSANPTWPRCWAQPWLCQFTGDGLGPGPHQIPGIEIENGCDVDSYSGTVDQLRSEWAA